MIKLIVTDMDGTLLCDKGLVPEEFFPLLDRLLSKGVVFAIASGRQYYTLVDNIKPFKKDIFFIAENGAMTMINDRVFSIYPMESHLVNRVIGAFYKTKGCEIVLCGEKSAYTASKNPHFLEECKKYYHMCRYVESIEGIDDQILKMAVYDYGGAENNSYKIFKEELEDGASILISEEYWLDFAKAQVDKGVALEKIQNFLDIGPENTLVFGDFYNDLPMFSRAKYSYSMENAPDEVKNAAAHVCRTGSIPDVILELEKARLL